MRIEFDYSIEDEPELVTRWIDATERSRAFTTAARFDFARRLEDLNILLDRLERDHNLKVSHQHELERLSRGTYWYQLVSGVSASVGILLAFAFNWSPAGEGVLLIAGAFFLGLFVRLYQQQRCEGIRAAASMKVHSDLFEFEQRSGMALSYNDLELLFEEGRSMALKPANVEIEDDRRRAEIIVAVYERLVEKVQRIDLNE